MIFLLFLKFPPSVIQVAPADDQSDLSIEFLAKDRRGELQMSERMIQVAQDKRWPISVALPTQCLHTWSVMYREKTHSPARRANKIMILVGNRLEKYQSS